MQITVPDYYKEFSCIAGECPDTCCAGWQIMIDKNSLLKYKNVKGVICNRLYNGIDWKQKSFKQYNGRCEFLNEDNLCDIYSEAGGEYLCSTCKKYPRHYEEYDGLTEISLSISCPEVARILLSKKEKVTFKNIERDKKEEEFEDFDFLLFSALMDVRDHLIEIIQKREIPMTQRICKAIVYVHDIQVCVNRGELFQWEDIARLHERTGMGEVFTKKIKCHIKNTSNIKEIVISMWKHIIPEMEMLRKNWRTFLKEHLEELYKGDDESYQKKIRKFIEDHPDWEIQQEQILVYWIFTYFGGAVYDGDAFTKLKMALISTLFVREICAGIYSEKQQEYSLEDLIKVAGWYSREMEHSDENLNMFEKILKGASAFRFDDLLRIGMNL